VAGDGIEPPSGGYEPLRGTTLPCTALLVGFDFRVAPDMAGAAQELDVRGSVVLELPVAVVTDRRLLHPAPPAQSLHRDCLPGPSPQGGCAGILKSWTASRHGFLTPQVVLAVTVNVVNVELTGVLGLKAAAGTPLALVGAVPLGPALGLAAASAILLRSDGLERLAAGSALAGLDPLVFNATLLGAVNLRGGRTEKLPLADRAHDPPALQLLKLLYLGAGSAKLAIRCLRDKRSLAAAAGLRVALWRVPHPPGRFDAALGRAENLNGHIR